MNWIVWPIAFLLCVLCAVGVVIKARSDEQTEHTTPAPENNRYYPVWLQSCIALSENLHLDPKQERTPDHAAAAKQK